MSREMQVVPSETFRDIPPNDHNYVKTFASDKQTKVSRRKAYPVLARLARALSIGLKLARIDGFDESFQLKGRDGFQVKNSDIRDLIVAALRPQQLLVGEDDFLELLYQAKVDPGDIFNENMRAKLISFYNLPRVKPQPIEEKKMIEIETDKIANDTDVRMKRIAVKRLADPSPSHIPAKRSKEPDDEEVDESLQPDFIGGEEEVETSKNEWENGSDDED